MDQQQNQILTVILVSGIIIFNYIIFIFYFLWEKIKYDNATYGFIFAFIQILVILLSISYYLAIKSSPGFVPDNINNLHLDIENLKNKAKIDLQNKLEYKKKQKYFLKYEKQTKLLQQERLDSENDENKVQSEQILQCQDFHNPLGLPWDITAFSYCFKCNKVKPPRAHHCKECQKCILRMDHHCIWIANCVGLVNHKQFCLFLLYSSFSLFFSSFLIGYDYLFGGYQISLTLNNTQLLYVVFIKIQLNQFSGNYKWKHEYCLSDCNWIFIYILNMVYWYKKYYYCRISYKGNAYRCFYYQLFIKKTNIKQQNPFKKSSFIENMKEIFGEEYKFWLIPWKQSQHNGDIYVRKENYL